MTKAPKSTGEMRGFLIEQMVKVVDGEQDHATALTVCRYAQQVYNICNLELKAANFDKKRGNVSIKSLEYKSGR